MILPKMPTFSSLNPVTMSLHMGKKNGLWAKIKLCILDGKWGSVMTKVFLKERGRKESRRQEKRYNWQKQGRVSESERVLKILQCRLWKVNGARGHYFRKADSRWWKRWEIRNSPRVSRRNSALLTPWFYSHKIHLKLRTSRLVRYMFVHFLKIYLLSYYVQLASI